MFCIVNVFIFAFMERETTTINISRQVKLAGQKEAKNLGLRGKFSEYVELLIKSDLQKKGITIQPEL